MKKSTKATYDPITTQISVEHSVEKNLKELEYKSKENAKFWVNTFDLISGGGFTKRRDNVSFEIWKNRLERFEEARYLMEKSGLGASKIDLRLQQEFFENTGLETNQTLQQKWVNLLANAATKKVDVKVRYTKILSELSEPDVFILDTLFEKNENMSVRDFEDNAKLDELKICVDGLFASSLIKSPFENPGRVVLVAENSKNDYEFEVEGKTYSDFSLTPLGLAFVQACKFDL